MAAASMVRLPTFSASPGRSSPDQSAAAAGSRRRRQAARSASCPSAVSSGATTPGQWRKSVWLHTQSKQVMTAAVEGGWTTFLFTQQTKHLAEEWATIARIESLFLNEGEILDSEGAKVGVFHQISSPQQLQDMTLLMGQAEVVVMDPLDWQIIPAENMVAAFHGTSVALFATARSATEARVFLETLEKGTDGVVLQTENPSEVSALREYFAMKVECTLKLSEAVVTRLEPVGLGDRVCVDLCSLMSPGEGLLVGSFAKTLFLVHNECLESSYIASRPFRVNAGPVHAYVASPAGRTRYLCELKSGDEVMVVDTEGRARTALVGRVKIESRPLILIETEHLAEGKSFGGSLLLQNAETVCLVQPPGKRNVDIGGREKIADKSVADLNVESGRPAAVIPVSKLKVGDKVLAYVQDGGRHAGVKIQEFIVEK